MKQCHQCGTPLPAPARFCIDCGAPQFQALDAGDAHELDLEAALEPQLTRRFFAALRRRIDEEQAGADLSPYIRRLQEHGFIDTVQRRAAQLAEEIRSSVARHGADRARIEGIVEPSFEELLDFFIIHQCRDINVLPLPEAILRYGTVPPADPSLSAVVLDYLDLEREEEDIYPASTFLDMPPDLLRNAGRHFLFPEKEERIFLICDQSLFGTCREGFAFTDRALYWKANLQKARKVAYAGIGEVVKAREWITINGHFFHVNPVLDVKVLKLMRRLRGWFSK